MMKVLIVDDEFPARRELRAQLARLPNVEVVGEAASAEEALQLIRALPYDVVFLDIEMPGMSGMELAQQVCNGPGPQVVFTTAYPQYAVDAFQVGAAGYLLKPFDEERLGRVLERVANHRPATGLPGGDPLPAPPKDRPATAPPRIPAERGAKTVLVHPSEIAFIYSQQEHVYIKLHNERLPCRFTLRQLADRLQQHGFLRVHRRFLVNLDKVREVIPYFKGSLSLVVTDAAQSEVPVSRNAAPMVRQRLGLTEH